MRRLGATVSSDRLSRRSLLLAAAALVAVPPVLRLGRPERPGPDPLREYQALVEALLLARALPGSPAGARGARDRLAAHRREALPGRRAEIDGVLAGLAGARLANREPRERIAELRRWAAAGGERRVLAARALALAGAAYGPVDRPLPVVI